MKTEYFQKGQTVYSHLFPSGKGLVTAINSYNLYPVQVEVAPEHIYTFTEDGRNATTGGIVLSANPLPVIVNTPIITFEKGDLVWYKDYKGAIWQAGYYSHYEKGRHYIFVKQILEGSSMIWQEVVPFEPRPF